MRLLTLTELALITKKGNTVFADDAKLKDLTSTQISDNIVLYWEKHGNWLLGKNEFYLWFVTEPKYATMLQAGEADILIFPIIHRYNMFDVSAINDIWKSSNLKRYKNSNYVVGAIQGFNNVETNEIVVNMMSVKPGYKFNNINRLMCDSLKDIFKVSTLTFDNPTEDGYAFINKYEPTAKITK